MSINRMSPVYLLNEQRSFSMQTVLGNYFPVENIEC